MVFDAGNVEGRSYSLCNGSFTLYGESQVGDALVLEPGRLVRGWIRRLAPPDWQRGVVVDSHDAAVKTAWLSLVVAVIRTSEVEWLTNLDALVSAENKLVQHAVATGLGVPAPETIVCSDADVAREALGSEIILKPLGVGHYFEEEEPFVVYTTEVDPGGAELEALSTVPFIAQRRLHARQHLRVVTVGGDAWAGAVDADQLTLDWRQEPIAHRSFTATIIPVEVRRGAIELADALHLGYSSQDWIVCDDACYIVDVNPGGQWLFLPEPITTEVNAAISGWLTGGTR
jgi:glutathione synthase/RimK-type ligase-like ATP-grasp enzyme